MLSKFAARGERDAKLDYETGSQWQSLWKECTSKDQDYGANRQVPVSESKVRSLECFMKRDGWAAYRYGCRSLPPLSWAPLENCKQILHFQRIENQDRNSQGISCAESASGQHQNLDRQLGALRAERCHMIFREKASGKSTRGRPELDKAIDELGKGDVLVVPEWDRATRSMMDGVHLIERINARGALIKVLDKPHLDLTTPIGRGFIAFLSALAEDERQRIVDRANAGRKVAKARGVKFGRKRKLTAHQQAEALRRLDKGETARAIGRDLNVHHATIMRLVG